MKAELELLNHTAIELLQMVVKDLEHFRLKEIVKEATWDGNYFICQKPQH